MKEIDYIPCIESIQKLIREYGMDAVLRHLIGFINETILNESHLLRESYLLRLKRHLQFALDEYRDRYELRSQNPQHLEKEREDREDNKFLKTFKLKGF